MCISIHVTNKGLIQNNKKISQNKVKLSDCFVLILVLSYSVILSHVFFFPMVAAMHCCTIQRENGNGNANLKTFLAVLFLSNASSSS